MVDKEKILLPEGFEDMVRGVIGDSEWDAFVEALADEPSVSIRVNGQRSMVNGQQSIGGLQLSTLVQTQYIASLQLSTVKWCEHGRYLSERPKFTYDPTFHAGA